MKFNKTFINTIPTFGDILIEFIDSEPEASILVYSPLVTATTNVLKAIDDPATGSYKLSKNFVNKMKLLCANEVDVEFKETCAIISSEKGKFKENYITTAFEKVKDAYKPEFSLNGKYIDHALGFAGKNEKKPILTGINISATHVIATDSFKLYCSGTYNPTETVTIVPDCAKIMAKANLVKISIGEHTVLFDIGDGWKYTSVFIAGEYPNVSRVLDYFNQGVRIDLANAKEALEIASSDSIQVHLTGKSDVHALSIDTEDYTTAIAMDIPNTGIEITMASPSVKELCKFGLSEVGYIGTLNPMLSFGENERVLFLPLRPKQQ